MPFIARFDLPRGRIYQHSAGAEMFKQNEQEKYVLNALARKSREFDYDFFISILWGDSHLGKTIDLSYYPFGTGDNWRTNPEPRNYIYKEGVWRVTHNVTCGDGWILLGREEENRRHSKNLEEFAKRPLELDFINSLLEFKP